MPLNFKAPKLITSVSKHWKLKKKNLYYYLSNICIRCISIHFKELFWLPYPFSFFQSSQLGQQQIKYQIISAIIPHWFCYTYHVEDLKITDSNTNSITSGGLGREMCLLINQYNIWTISVWTLILSLVLDDIYPHKTFCGYNYYWDIRRTMFFLHLSLCKLEDTVINWFTCELSQAEQY